jgi:hypothetical protein
VTFGQGREQILTGAKPFKRRALLHRGKKSLRALKKWVCVAEEGACFFEANFFKKRFAAIKIKKY